MINEGVEYKILNQDGVINSAFCHDGDRDDWFDILIEKFPDCNWTKVDKEEIIERYKGV